MSRSRSLPVTGSATLSFSTEKAAAAGVGFSPEAAVRSAGKSVADFAADHVADHFALSWCQRRRGW